MTTAAPNDEDCSTPSLLPRNVTIVAGTIYLLFVVIVSVYSFNFLMKYDIKFIKSSKIKKFKIWIIDVWKRRKCYIPIIAHIFDQITDISVAMQFYLLATTSNDPEWQHCNGLNIWYLFILTILSMVIYRLISSYLIYQTTKSIKRFFVQILDFELFQALYINYLCNNTEPCDPQRWITTLESTLESSPQALIQLIYLVKTGTFNSSYLVTISLVSSLICIISKVVSDDKRIVVTRAQKLNFKFKLSIFTDPIIVVIYIIYIMFAIIITFIICIVSICCFCICCPCLMVYKIVEELDFDEIVDFSKDNDGLIPITPFSVEKSFREMKQIVETFLNIEKRFKWISLLYILRFMWRILDVSSHILLMSLIWIAIGGVWLTIKVAIECVIFLGICIVTGQWELLFGIIVTVISTTTDKSRNISIVIGTYRIIINITFIILISIWLYTNFECWKCTDYTDRQTFAKDYAIYIIFVYTWIAVIASPICIILLFYYNVFKLKTSTSRDLEKMIAANNYNGIIEMQLYIGEYGIYDKNNDKTLLMLAMKQNNAAVVSYLLNRMEKYDDKDKNGSNILDYYMDAADGDNINYRPMTNNLMKIYKKNPDMKSKQQFTTFLCACYYGESDCIKQLANLDANVLNDETENGINGATLAIGNNHTDIVDYLSETHNITAMDVTLDNVLTNANLTTMLPYINKKDRNTKTSAGYSPFLVACYHGDLATIKILIDSDKSVLSDSYRGSKNAANTAVAQHHTDVVNYLYETHGIKPSLPKSKEKRLLILGLDKGGKTTLLYMWKLGEVVTTIPTGGFNVETVEYKNLQFTIWDIGGAEKLRPLWSHYYDTRQIDGIIFVVDSIDPERLDEAKEALKDVVNHKDIISYNPLLGIVANKQDCPNAMSKADVAKALELNKISLISECFEVSVTEKRGIMDVLDWMLVTI